MPLPPGRMLVQLMLFPSSPMALHESSVDAECVALRTQHTDMTRARTQAFDPEHSTLKQRFAHSKTPLKT